MTATAFIEELTTHKSQKEHAKISGYFEEDGRDNRIIGVRMKTIFDLAKANMDMPLNEVSKLLDEPWYEARMGAVSILDFKARKKNITESDHKKLYDLYLNRHDRINTWDFVDRSAPYVIGGYLHRFDKPRDILYTLAQSNNQWERRTAIVATGYFIRKNETDDTFQIAGELIHDKEVMVQKAIGTWIRHAGQKDPDTLLSFLEKHASLMPRPVLTTAMEKLEPAQKKYFRSL